MCIFYAVYSCALFGGHVNEEEKFNLAESQWLEPEDDECESFNEAAYEDYCHEFYESED
jgi:hypothetical protein